MERRSLKTWTLPELKNIIQDRGRRLHEISRERNLLHSDIALLTAEVARRAGNEQAAINPPSRTVCCPEEWRIVYVSPEFIDNPVPLNTKPDSLGELNEDRIRGKQTCDDFIKVVRQEAIDWIKEEVTHKTNERLPLPESQVMQTIVGILELPEIKRWMERFNLTLEDLR